MPLTLWRFEENPGNPYDGVKDPVDRYQTGLCWFWKLYYYQCTIKSINADYVKEFRPGTTST